MPQQCKICQRSDRTAIEDALQNATSLRDVAAQYGVSKDGLARHKASHMPAVVPTPKPTKTKRDEVRRTMARHADRARVEQMPRPQGVRIPDEIKPDVQDDFLEQFMTWANESKACREVNISRSTVRWWEEHDTDFAIRYRDAKEEVNDQIRGEIYRRGVIGYDDLIVSAKGESFEVTRYSDRLLEFLAKSRMSEFREKAQLEIGGKDGGPIRMAISNLSDTELELLERMAEKATRE